MSKINIREIRQSDNPALSEIVKGTLAEFGANHPNTVYYDPGTDTRRTDADQTGFELRDHLYYPRPRCHCAVREPNPSHVRRQVG